MQCMHLLDMGSISKNSESRENFKFSFSIFNPCLVIAFGFGGDNLNPFLVSLVFGGEFCARI